MTFPGKSRRELLGVGGGDLLGKKKGGKGRRQKKNKVENDCELRATERERRKYIWMRRKRIERPEFRGLQVFPRVKVNPSVAE